MFQKYHFAAGQCVHHHWNATDHRANDTFRGTCNANGTITIMKYANHEPHLACGLKPWPLASARLCSGPGVSVDRAH